MKYGTWSENATCVHCGKNGASCTDSSGIDECDECISRLHKEWKAKLALLEDVPPPKIESRKPFSFREWLWSLWFIKLPPLPKANES